METSYFTKLFYMKKYYFFIQKNEQKISKEAKKTVEKFESNQKKSYR